MIVTKVTQIYRRFFLPLFPMRILNAPLLTTESVRNASPKLQYVRVLFKQHDFKVKDSEGCLFE